jgi:hypothetical protein
VLLDSGRPGGYIVEGEHFLAEHAPLQESSAGTVILEARRHLLDFGDMTPAELAEFGSTAHRLVPAIKAATGSSASISWRLWSARPTSTSGSYRRRTRESSGGVAYLAQQPPLTTSFSAAEATSRKIREQFEQS